MRDALILLRDPIEPETYNGGGDSVTWWYVCGACKCSVSPGDHYCRSCGRAVKWYA